MEVLILLLIGTFIPVLLSVNIAQKRNRSGGKAAFVTLFTGWIGTVIIWLFLADHSAFTKNDFDNVVKKLRKLELENEKNKANNPL